MTMSLSPARPIRSRLAGSRITALGIRSPVADARPPVTGLPGGGPEGAGAARGWAARGWAARGLGGKGLGGKVRRQQNRRRLRAYCGLAIRGHRLRARQERAAVRIAEPELAAAGDIEPLHPHRTPEGPVRAARVLDQPAARFGAHDHVQPRHPRVVDHQVRSRITADAVAPPGTQRAVGPGQPHHQGGHAGGRNSPLHCHALTIERITPPPYWPPRPPRPARTR